MSRRTVDRIWKSIAAGIAGSIAHSLLMYLKSRAGLLTSFQPYDNLQATLSHLVGSAVDPMVPWALSFLNGSTLVGLVFGYSYQRLPGKTGVTKGAVFGVFGWIIMGLAFFPIIGLGFFALDAGLGISPALFSLMMLLSYSIVMGTVYNALYAKDGKTGKDRLQHW
ncbi:hypothetical protein H1B27_22960 [Bradyrhizobium sp. CNPSo 4019]|uniref:Uncharacterized protein n=2 Tax=Bradyrhizobium diversitatis TaxID=2755406 RepID=A0ABS0P741_9BRAD|nr:hypothetical protein [Bradyrhizobium diversitatis]